MDKPPLTPTVELRKGKFMVLSEDQIKEYKLDISIWEENIQDLKTEQEYTSSPTKIHKIGKEIADLKDKIAKIKLLLSANKNVKNTKPKAKLTQTQITKLSKFKLSRSIRSVIVRFPAPLSIAKLKIFFAGYELKVLQGDGNYATVLKLSIRK